MDIACESSVHFGFYIECQPKISHFSVAYVDLQFTCIFNTVSYH